MFNKKYSIFDQKSHTILYKMLLVNFIVHFPMNSYNADMLKMGVLGSLLEYFNGGEFTINPNKEICTQRLYYYDIPRNKITNDLLHQLNIMDDIEFRILPQHKGNYNFD